MELKLGQIVYYNQENINPIKCVIRDTYTSENQEIMYFLRPLEKEPKSYILAIESELSKADFHDDLESILQWDFLSELTIAAIIDDYCDHKFGVIPYFGEVRLEVSD